MPSSSTRCVQYCVFGCDTIEYIHLSLVLADTGCSTCRSSSTAGAAKLVVSVCISVGKSRCNVGGNVGVRGNPLLSTLKLFKYRPTLPHIATTPTKCSLTTSGRIHDDVVPTKFARQLKNKTSLE